MVRVANAERRRRRKITTEQQQQTDSNSTKSLSILNTVFRQNKPESIEASSTKVGLNCDSTYPNPARSAQGQGQPPPSISMTSSANLRGVEQNANYVSVSEILAVPVPDVEDANSNVRNGNVNNPTTVTMTSDGVVTTRNENGRSDNCRKPAGGGHGNGKRSSSRSKASPDKYGQDSILAGPDPTEDDSPLLGGAVSVSEGWKKSVGTGSSPKASISIDSNVKCKSGNKNPALKRVSFGSNRTMVETLIFETPPSEEDGEIKTADSSIPTTSSTGAGPPPTTTPILKPAETNDSIDSTLSGNSTSGSSRPPSRVRVTFFESEKPLAVSSPEESDLDFELNMTTIPSPIADGTTIYHRQMSGEIGWENPFRPDGDLSREADQIVELIKEGKPINDETLRSKSPLDVLHSTTYSFANASPPGKAGAKNGNQNEVVRGVVAPANQTGVEHVTLKKKKGGCCVVQ